LTLTTANLQFLFNLRRIGSLDQITLNQYASPN